MYLLGFIRDNREVGDAKLCHLNLKLTWCGGQKSSMST